MLAKKTQYAMKALAYMADRRSDNPILISEIAAKKKIPLKFLESILLELRKAGILESKKGKGGGYFFSQAPDTIKLAAVIRLMEGPIALLPCVSLNFYKKCTDCNEKKCGLNRVMKEVRDSTLQVLENRTIADLAIL
ncbi:MAG: RrF2 family transcriptional regulator [Sediminibacterium sp.]|jgi:Rrf2 family protein|nr:Rrf2 family transcriptional regulator [Chitinophagaceae bacterium]MCA6446365.1 Rrf2 family transcriptional regulator [Chitinophagaceae bacterium]